MTILSSSRPKLSIPLAAIVVILFSISGSGQTVTENALDTDLGYRGQGRANLCYAFTEEQLLKDTTCAENCDVNASQWKFSIFDIAKVHQSKWIKDHGRASINGDLTVDLLSNGASDVFPFQEFGVQSIRASQCTLEKELFFLNRSKITNPDRSELEDFIMDLYAKLKNGYIIPVPDSDKSKLKATLNILNSLSHEAASKNDFLTKVVNYKKCETEVSIPKLTAQTKNISDANMISALIEPLLKQKKSLYVGVCAEILVSEKDDGSPCGRHAVALKNIRNATCGNNTCGNEIQVVDSAFFSLRPRNVDGSSWLPESIVILAIQKSAKDFEQIASKSSAAFESVDTSALAESIDGVLRPQLQHIRRDQFQAKVLDALKVFTSQLQTDPANAKLFSNIYTEISKLQMNSLSDLNQIPAAVHRAMVLFMSNGPTIQGNGIVWLE